MLTEFWHGHASSAITCSQVGIFEILDNKKTCQWYYDMLTGGILLRYVGLGHAMALPKNAHRQELFLLMYFLDMSETGSQVHCCKSVRTDGANNL